MTRDSETPRQASYQTTPRFLKLFGLESLADLPRSQDLEPR
jgi:chromosome segregation and condensation protein ScpB